MSKLQFFMVNDEFYSEENGVENDQFTNLGIRNYKWDEVSLLQNNDKYYLCVDDLNHEVACKEVSQKLFNLLIKELR